MKATNFLHTEISRQCLSVAIDSIYDQMEQLVKIASIGEGKDQGKKIKLLIHIIHENRMGFLSWKYCYFRVLVECDTESMFLILNLKMKQQCGVFFFYFFTSTEMVLCCHASMHFSKTSVVFLAHSSLHYLTILFKPGHYHN